MLVHCTHNRQLRSWGSSALIVKFGSLSAVEFVSSHFQNCIITGPYHMETIALLGLRQIHRRFIIWTPIIANSESGYHEKKWNFSPKKRSIIKSSYLALEFLLCIHCKKTENSSRWQNLRTQNPYIVPAFIFSLFWYYLVLHWISFSLGTHKMVRMCVQYGRSKKTVFSAFYFLIFLVWCATNNKFCLDPAYIMLEQYFPCSCHSQNDSVAQRLWEFYPFLSIFYAKLCYYLHTDK